MFNRTRRLFVCAVCATLALAFTTSAKASPLLGSGTHIPIPSINPGEPPRQGAALSSIIVPSSFDGTWTAPAEPDWIGTWSAQGPVPSSTANPAGTTRFDFTTLPTAVLPSGTIFFFGDVDAGAGETEQFILTATDSGGGLITTPWLDEPIGVSGSGTGGGGSVISDNMPGWDWNSSTGEYLIDGTTVGSNPSVAVWILSNTDIASMSVVRTSAFANFGLSAPIVPEPATASLLALGGAVALCRRRKV